ncbi:response regulator transcription factor [bacterium]|nr:response regulator transcription factor [bacterium]
MRVLLVDDHGIVLQGLEALLSTADHLEIVGKCVNGREAVDFVTADAPDILILDLGLPELSGLEVLSVLADRGCLPPTILMAATAEEWEVREALKRGAWGFVMKDQAPMVILDCIQAAAAGQPWDPEPAFGFLDRGPSRLPSDLTARERQIARRVIQGQSNKAIARTLGIAEGTVKVHLHRAFKKLGVGNRVQLAMGFQEEPA